MFANTLTVTIDGAAKVLVRRNQDNFGSEYRLVNGVSELILKIRHSKDNQNGTPHDRANVFIEHRIFATPTSVEKYASVSTTLRRRDGTDPDMLNDLTVGLQTLVTSLLAGLVQGEA